MASQEIACCDCGAVFVFSDAERAFYEGKGLSYPPRRCKTCRVLRRSSGGLRAAQPGDREARPLYDIVCAACGAPGQVPFRPVSGREVFCKGCHRARQPGPTRELDGIHVNDDDAGIVE